MKGGSEDNRSNGQRRKWEEEERRRKGRRMRGRDGEIPEKKRNRSERKQE